MTDVWGAVSRCDGFSFEHRQKIKLVWGGKPGKGMRGYGPQYVSDARLSYEQDVAVEGICKRFQCHKD